MAINNAVNATVQGFQSLNSTTGVWNGRTITGAAGVTVTNGDGTAGNPTISIAGAGFTWTNEATSFAAVAENGYMSTAASVVATLPAAGSVNGATIAFVASTSSAFKIQPSTSDLIQLGDVASTNGTGGGYIQSTAIGDSVELVYQSTSGIWFAVRLIGNWTYV